MYQLRQRGAVAGGLCGRLFVQYLNTPVGAGGAENKRARQFSAGGDQRACQATFTGPRQGHRMLDALIGHQSSHGAERFNGVYRRGLIRLRAEQQRRREECARGVEIRATTQQHFTSGFDQTVYIILYVLTLFVVHQRAHLHAFLRRVTERHFLQARNQRVAHRFHLCLRHDNTADGGALLPGLRRHFSYHFANEQRELRLLRRDVVTEYATV
ncbi:hypothetical protein SB00175_03793 [Klebsiella oxytoca]|nr:hypothetical protein SB00175_03793 [Klebsiella oxytoca]